MINFSASINIYMLVTLSKENSLLNQYIAEVRNVEVQNDRMRFRRNIERIGEIFAYEISKKLSWETKEVVTPLGIANVPILKEQPVIATILRAGLPLHQGLLNYFDNADNAFISAYRRHHKDGKFDIKMEYTSSPSLNDRTLILADSMLATGASMALAYKSLLQKGKPSHTHLVVVLASRDGLEYIRRHFSSNDITLWVGAVDEELTAQAYIVPGLGDAGDLAYGGKN